jgi:hypothetical protein
MIAGQFLIVAIYLVIWKVIDKNEISIHDEFVMTANNVRDIQKYKYCSFSHWDIAINIPDFKVAKV